MTELDLTPKNMNYNLMSNNQYVAIMNWRNAHGGFTSHPKFAFLKLFEEVVELGLESGCSVDEMWRGVEQVARKEQDKGNFRQHGDDHADREGIFLEYGDVAACLTAFIEGCQINTTMSVDAMLDRVAGRQWTPDEHGVLRRPK